MHSLGPFLRVNDDQTLTHSSTTIPSSSCSLSSASSSCTARTTLGPSHPLSTPGESGRARTSILTNNNNNPHSNPRSDLSWYEPRPACSPAS